MTRGSTWKKKSTKKTYLGTYDWHKGERVFVLVPHQGGSKITMESWQMAKKLGWSIL